MNKYDLYEVIGTVVAIGIGVYVLFKVFEALTILSKRGKD
jgi:hypothetical protein